MGYVIQKCPQYGKDKKYLQLHRKLRKNIICDDCKKDNQRKYIKEYMKTLKFKESNKNCSRKFREEHRDEYRKYHRDYQRVLRRRKMKEKLNGLL